MKHFCGAIVCRGHDGQNEACDAPRLTEHERQEAIARMRKHVSARSEAAMRKLIDEEREKALRSRPTVGGDA